MSATKDKRGPAGLEGVIDSDRFKLVEFLGRGCWGSVYAAHDTVLDKTVAIKVLDPNELAKKQMQERKLDALAAMKNEALDLQACAHIVPRTFELDKNGTPFIVMPKYEKFFSDVIAESKISGTKWGPFGEEKPLKNGFFMSDIIQFAGDLANGLNEIHDTYGRAHCDIKPDNLPVDKNGKVMISDMGTSTFASVGMLKGPRDNMGYAYTRAPQLFVEGAHPRKSSDVFAFGSLLYKMFTGEYILQKELEAESVKGEDAVKEYMRKLAKRPYSYEFSKIIHDKLGESDIPREFRDLISRCVHEEFQDGRALKNGLEYTIKKYTENGVKKSKFDEFKTNMKKKFIAALIGGTIFAGGAIGIGWVNYFSVKPDFSSKTDVDSMVRYRTDEKAEAIFELEKKYDGERVKVGQIDHSYLLDSHLKYFGIWDREQKMIDNLTTEWIKAATDVGGELITNDMLSRYHLITRGSDSTTRALDNNKIIELFSLYIGDHQTEKNIVDLEDAVTAMRVGRTDLYRAQKSAKSTEFADYLTTKDAAGAYIIPYADQVFLKRVLYRIQEGMPKWVRVKK